MGQSVDSLEDPTPWSSFSLGKTTFFRNWKSNIATGWPPSRERPPWWRRSNGTGVCDPNQVARVRSSLPVRMGCILELMCPSRRSFRPGVPRRREPRLAMNTKGDVTRSSWKCLSIAGCLIRVHLFCPGGSEFSSTFFDHTQPTILPHCVRGGRFVSGRYFRVPLDPPRLCRGWPSVAPAGWPSVAPDVQRPPEGLSQIDERGCCSDLQTQRRFHRQAPTHGAALRPPPWTEARFRC